MLTRHYNIGAGTSNETDLFETSLGRLIDFIMDVMTANGLDNVSETFKLQIFEVISTIRKNSKRSDSKALQEYIINNSASNIKETFVLD